jgi:GTP pyrophosphokinase
MELAELVADLKMDQSAVLAAVLYRGVREHRFSREAIETEFGPDVAGLVHAVAAMATTSLLEMSNSPLLEKENRDQVENIKRMLAALIDDVRVAVLKLAERVVALRQAKDSASDRRTRIAEEARSVFAPLANRLGIWQLKWELEDLSLRYLQEDVYKDIAKRLANKRSAREKQVLHMVDQVRALLRGHGIEADVYGRAKNIFSIWRKMQSKGVSFDQVYDVRAVRVVVESLADCYAALGVIHTTWPHIPSEFDDYIAAPKENGYQSIHTAVTVADGNTLEVQIRTRAMHEESELGVCAHWSYKDSGDEDDGFAAKMDWLRQVMEWHEELGGTEQLSELLRERVAQERIYVSTPRGHVVDLSSGATALDFAYRVHTDVGHTCRGALVNGIHVPLSCELKTGEQVTIVTADAAVPERAWLEPELQLLRTHRARAKVLSYFRALPTSGKRQAGKSLLTSYLDGLGIGDSLETIVERLCESLCVTGEDELYARIGGGELGCLGPLIDLLDAGGIDDLLSLPGLPGAGFPESARLRIVGENREGLLHDVTQIIAGMHLPLTATTGRVSNPPTQAIITVDVTLSSWGEGLRLLSYISLLNGVTEVRRQGS